jgi:hypothetical protein
MTMPEIKSLFFITPSLRHWTSCVCTADTPYFDGLHAYWPS